MLRTRSPRKEKISNCYLHSNSLSNKMDNSLLAVRDINHKYIVVAEDGGFIILLEKSMYFKGNLVLQVPFLPSKTLMFYQMTLKIKRIMQGVTLLVIAVIFG